MFSKPPLKERIAAMKARKDRAFFALRLREDLAELIEKGIRDRAITQRELARMAGKKESYISRLINAATNFKIGVAAQVLVPLGIVPVLIDKSELDRLRSSRAIPRGEFAESFPAPSERTRNEVLNTQERLSYGKGQRADGPGSVESGRWRRSADGPTFVFGGDKPRLERRVDGSREVCGTEFGGLRVGDVDVRPVSS